MCLEDILLKTLSWAKLPCMSKVFSKANSDYPLDSVVQIDTLGGSIAQK